MKILDHNGKPFEKPEGQAGSFGFSELTRRYINKKMVEDIKKKSFFFNLLPVIVDKHGKYICSETKVSKVKNGIRMPLNEEA